MRALGRAFGHLPSRKGFPPLFSPSPVFLLDFNINEMKTKQIMGKMEEMAEEQRNYAIRKARREEIKERVREAIKPINEKIDQLNPREDREKMKELIDKVTEIERKMGLIKANEKLREAERRLVDWFFKEIEGKKEFDHINKKEIKENWGKYPTIREKMVSLAFRYNPN